MKSSLPDLNEENTINDIEHIENCTHGWWLDLYRRNDCTCIPFTNLIHFLLKNNRLLSEMSQTFRTFLRFFMLLSQLMLVNGKGFLLILKCTPEVTLTGLCSCNKVVTDSYFQTLCSKVSDIECKTILQEPKRKVILSNCVQDQSDVALREKEMSFVNQQLKVDQQSRINQQLKIEN